MVSSFPKMQKSSASFSQSIRNRLRLKNLQAQAKNFCRVLDIRVSQVMKANMFQVMFLKQLRKIPCYAVRIDQIANFVNTYIIQILFVVAPSAQSAIFLLFLS